MGSLAQSLHNLKITALTSYTFCMFVPPRVNYYIMILNKKLHILLCELCPLVSMGIMSFLIKIEVDYILLHFYQ